MPIIEIEVRDKVARAVDQKIVCGNGNYVVQFSFDEEWAEHETKTARFSFNGKYEDVIFTGNNCPVPIIIDAIVCSVGVFAGNLQATTPALVKCVPSILCKDGVPADPMPDVYAQLIEMYENIQTGVIPPETIEKAVEDYLEEHPVQGGATAEESAQIAQNKEDIEKLATDKLDADKLPQAVNDALAQAKASGEFKGDPGDDYVLTEADKKEIAGMVEVPGGGGGGGLTEETDPTVPDWAKQPQKPKYTAAEVGAATEKYVDDAIANINIPSGGGSAEWKLVDTFDFSSGALSYTADATGCKEILVVTEVILVCSACYGAWKGVGNIFSAYTMVGIAASHRSSSW